MRRSKDWSHTSYQTATTWASNYRIQVRTASRSGAMSVGGSTGLAPNNSRARFSNARTSFNCC
jgi:hypothetical protein